MRELPRASAAWYPWVPVTPARVHSQFHGTFGPYPAGAVVRLWNHCDFMRGRCPRCGGEVLGFAFGGNLSRGHISGTCRDCAACLRSVNGGPRGSVATVTGPAYLHHASKRRTYLASFAAPLRRGLAVRPGAEAYLPGALTG